MWNSFIRTWSLAVLLLCAIAGRLAAQPAGTLVGWGRQVVLEPPAMTGLVAVAGGHQHSLGLKEDGSAIAWGDNGFGQCRIPETNEQFVALDGGDSHSLGLRADGTVVAWGTNTNGQCNDPVPNAGFIAIAAGGGGKPGTKAGDMFYCFALPER